jgi:hypothetical protein
LRFSYFNGHAAKHKTAYKVCCKTPFFPFYLHILFAC